MKRFARVVVAALLAGIAAAPARAHVGSPDTWFEGKAGPYPVRVVVRFARRFSSGEIEGLDRDGLLDFLLGPFRWS